MAPNDRWSMDFLRDTLASARVIRLFTGVDDCTREALQLVVETSFPGQRVLAALDEARRTVAAYQLLYNTGRRHGALGTMTPSEYAVYQFHIFTRSRITIGPEMGGNVESAARTRSCCSR